MRLWLVWGLSSNNHTNAARAREPGARRCSTRRDCDEATVVDRGMIRTIQSVAADAGIVLPPQAQERMFRPRIGPALREGERHLPALVRVD